MNSQKTFEMLPEYDFSKMTGAVRGKYYQAMQSGYSVTIHKADGTTEEQKVTPATGEITSKLTKMNKENI